MNPDFPTFFTTKEKFNECYFDVVKSLDDTHVLVDTKESTVTVKSWKSLDSNNWIHSDIINFYVGWLKDQLTSCWIKGDLRSSLGPRGQTFQNIALLTSFFYPWLLARKRDRSDPRAWLG